MSNPIPHRLPVPAYQHPVGRLMHSGASALSNAELLAAIIRTGTAHEDALHLAERILSEYDGLPGLAQANTAQLNQIDGLGGAKAAQIVAALELSRRLMHDRRAEHTPILSGADAAALVMDMAELQQEHVRVLLLDSARQVTASPTIYIGTANATVLRVAEVFRQAVAFGSSAIILAHNHPSGNPTPSPEDAELTRALANAGRLLDITLVDHLIIGRGCWVSMREQGFLG
ncbi:MAG: DNA repair protein RadC [Anaerolineae bacterium]|nr:DNA repair protein RadC [Anaerolineae bacterium]